jgi:hypothetical protein
MAGNIGGSNSLLGAPISSPFLPTRSRRRKEPTLVTCGGENGSQTTGGSSFQRRSGSKVHSGGGGVGGGSSSKRRIGVGGLGEVDQRRRLGCDGSVLGQIRMG